MIFCATCPAPPSSAPGRISANSSPPSRATVSVSRSSAVMRRATSPMRRSPAWCPKVSFISLKRSRSITRRASGVASRRAVRRACSRRSRSRDRFGRPVRVSCSACRSSSCSAFLRSVTSVKLETTSRTRPNASLTGTASTKSQRTYPSARIMPIITLRMGSPRACAATFGTSSSGMVVPSSRTRRSSPGASRPSSSSGGRPKIRFAAAFANTTAPAASRTTTPHAIAS